MRGGAVEGEAAGMALATRTSPLLEHAPYVFGAAAAACRDGAAAEAVTELVLTTAVWEGDGGPSRGQLIEEALLVSVRVAPARCFSIMTPREREVVALAQLAGYSVSAISAALEAGADTVKVLMISGLRKAAGSAAVVGSSEADRGAQAASLYAVAAAAAK